MAPAAELVTVIVPVHDAGPFLEPCVASVLAQTHSELDVILVDDGSTDGSSERCDAFAAADSRVRVIHRPNGGIGAAQNDGLDAMMGGHVTFCDDDDLMAPRLVERLLAVLTDNDADMSQCRWANVGASQAAARLRREAADPGPPGRVVAFEHPAAKYQAVFAKTDRALHRDGEFLYLNLANWAKLYRAELWAGTRFPEGVFAQDAYLGTELCLKMTRVAACSDTLYYWLQREGSVTHRSRSFRYHKDILDCAFHNIDVAQAAGILPRRSFYALLMERPLITPSAETPEERAVAREYVARCAAYLAALPPKDRLAVWRTYALRRAETFAYSKTVHRRT